MEDKPILRTYPRQGEIYLIKPASGGIFGEQYLAIIVSNNLRNNFTNSVLVVPLLASIHSDLNSQDSPTRVLIRQGEGHLENDALAICENISALHQSYLQRGDYTHIHLKTFRAIQQAIQIAIGI